jgi:hypothetical protein
MRKKEEISSQVLAKKPLSYEISRDEVLECMDDYAAEVATKFLEWVYTEGWQNYDSHETWINLEKNNIVLTTNNLFIKFKEENNI